MTTSDDILRFWFEETAPAAWWRKDPEFDAQLGHRFAAVLARAACCELQGWRSTPAGRLAEVIVLDQFSRNIHRDTPAAFAQDPLALALAQEAIAAQADLALSPVQRSFFYMPFMHSESALIHEQALDLFTRLGQDSNLVFEQRHREIILRFGRYPHRNQILGRTSTAQELLFLAQPGSGF
jgi:uncharacterized protein (DUF924 family)